MLPSRLTVLVKKIEAGETVTSADLDRVAALQSFDIIQAGRQFVEDWCKREDEQTDVLRKALEAT